MKDIDLGALRTFTVVAETKNFSRAANLICRSQSAVSVQIQRLEEYLGVKLLLRSSRRVILTSHGEKLLVEAKLLLLQSKKIVKMFDNNENVGEISFGTPEGISNIVLPHIIANFNKKYPKVNLQVNNDTSTHLLKGYRANLYDIILIIQRVGILRLGAVGLFSSDLVWVCGKAFQGKSLDDMLAAKKELPLVLAPTPCIIRDNVLQALEAKRIKYKIVYSTRSLTGMGAALRAGLGIGVLPRYNVTPDLEVLDSEKWLELCKVELSLLANSKDRAVNLFKEYILLRLGGKTNKKKIKSKEMNISKNHKDNSLQKQLEVET